MSELLTMKLSLKGAEADELVLQGRCEVCGHDMLVAGFTDQEVKSISKVSLLALTAAKHKAATALSDATGVLVTAWLRHRVLECGEIMLLAEKIKAYSTVNGYRRVSPEDMATEFDVTVDMASKVFLAMLNKGHLIE